jgi:hypothetical protein
MNIKLTGPYITHKTTLVVLPLCISYICGTSCEQESVEAVESIPELVHCSVHLQKREVTQDGGTV